MHKYQDLEVKKTLYQLLTAIPNSRVHDFIILLVLSEDHGISF